MAAKKKIAIEDHWEGELSKIRCWIDGFKTARNVTVLIPGEDTLRQIQVALKDAR